jgi:superfamily II DNA/RNA helicase
MTSLAPRTAAPSRGPRSPPRRPRALVAALARQGIAEPFPIQVATLPDTLAGRDVLGRGRTGSGKTLAFSLPLVTRLSGGRRRPRQARGLVLVPTRELANQVLAVVQPLAQAAG